MEKEKEKQRRHGHKKSLAMILLSMVIAIGAVVLYFYLEYKKTHISTDDAFVDGRIHLVASKVPGTVRALHIRDNEHVKNGQLLLELDPADYEVKVAEARADLEIEKTSLSEIHKSVETARKRLAEIDASLEAARANLELQKANLELARVDLQRAEFLVGKGAIPKQQYDNAKTKYDVTVAQARAAADQVKQSEASVQTQVAVIQQTESSVLPQEATIRQKEAALRTAELNLSYTKLYAPAEGYVTRRTVEVGNQIQVTQPLMAVVPLAQQSIWITANYKETQLTHVKPGQKVEIKVDTYPGKVFHGTVNSIMAGTGAVFSLFPPENATGNFVKVVQRIPVKIVLDPGADPGHLLRIGMSVRPTILVEP
jgi:membrane fusion protein (multidrug efflux system)